MWIGTNIVRRELWNATEFGLTAESEVHVPLCSVKKSLAPSRLTLANLKKLLELAFADFPTGHDTTTSLEATSGGVTYSARSSEDFLSLIEPLDHLDSLELCMRRYGREAGPYEAIRHVHVWIGSDAAYVAVDDRSPEWAKGRTETIRDFVGARRPWYSPILLGDALYYGFLGAPLGLLIPVSMQRLTQRNVWGALASALACTFFAGLFVFSLLRTGRRPLPHSLIVLDEAKSALARDSLGLAVGALGLLLAAVALIVSKA